MKLAVLFSGGKDSCYALHIARESHEISCLITVQSDNSESFMFHTPNIQYTELQSESLGIPLITVRTKGEKEKELSELKEAIAKAKEMFFIEGIVTGAIASVYQATRIQKICDELSLWCFNPLWQKDQLRLLNDLIDKGFEVLISGVSAFPFEKEWLGRKIDSNAIKELASFQEKYKINPAGEGGEIETLVVNGPDFSKRISVKKASVKFSNHSGIYIIKEAVLE